MNTPFERAEDIGLEIARRVALCTKMQGAETDIGATVFNGRRHVDDQMIPCATVIEGKDEVEHKGAATNVSLGQHYVVYAYVPCDPDSPNTAAHAAIRDIKRALFTTDGKPDVTWSHSVRRVQYRGRDIGPRADGAAFVVVGVAFSIEYVENLALP